MLRIMSSDKRQLNTRHNITPGELQQRLEANEAVIVVDVRTSEEFAHEGHIFSSRLLPLSYLRQRSDELPKDKPIVVVCRSGERSQVACEQLAALGFTDIFNLAGGIDAWQQAKLPLRLW